MKYLREVTFDDISNVIVESENKDKSYYIEGVFMQCEIINKNKRLYPLPITEQEVNRYTKEKITTNRALGELNHADNISINPERASHKIISLIKDGNNFIGKAKIITQNPCGRIIKGLIDENITFGVSSRCLGSYNTEGDISRICDDLYIITPADIVSDPSAPDAFVNAIMENKEWIMENGIIYEHDIKNIINKEYDKKTNHKEFDAKLFEKIISLL
jgi:hypothetical protein